jgi:cytochrome c-type biogenesis protein CcmE
VELTPRRVDDDGADDDGDEGGGDVTGRRGPRPRRRWLPMLVLGAVVVVGGVFVYRGLSDAALYFRNADEAVAERDELGDRRFRLQGTVADEPTTSGGTVDFQVTFGGAVVDVRHTGDPPELFRAGVPVVLEGAWSGDVYASDRIMVRHDEEYQSEEDYEERQREAEEGGAE